MNDENKEDPEVQNVEMNDENKEIEKFRMSRWMMRIKRSRNLECRDE